MGPIVKLTNKRLLKTIGFAIGFSKPGALHENPRFHPQRLGRFAPLSFTAYGGKIQATRVAGGR
jgi:hypothetical protein